MRLALCAWLVLAGAPAQEPPWNGESYGLFLGEHASGRIRFLVPSGPCENAAERLAKAIEAEGVFEVAEKDDERAIRVLAGSPADPELESLARACGVEPIEGGFRVLQRDYREPGDAAVAVFADPESSGRPLCLVLGNDRELVAHYLDRIPRLSRPHLWVHADGELAFECTLGPGGRPRAQDARDYLARRKEYFASGLRLELEYFDLHARGQPEEEQWRAYLTALALTRERVAKWFEVEKKAEAETPEKPDEPEKTDKAGEAVETPTGETVTSETETNGETQAPEETPPAPGPPKVELWLYEHLEDFERCTGTSALSVANRLHPRVHVLLAPGMPDDSGAGMARVLARAVAGTPAEGWVEDGMAVAAAGRWWRRPLDRWVGHLTSAQLLPKPEELLAPMASRDASAHAARNARVGMRYQSEAQEAAKRLGAAAGKTTDAPRKRGRAGRARAPGAGEKPAARQATPRQELEPTTEDGDVPNAARGPRRPDGNPATSLRRGLALVAVEPASYASRSLDEALARAQELGLGPNAVSLTVFGSAEDPLPAACTPAPRNVHASSSDLALASAAAAAREREMSVLLALEVLSGPGGSWADNLSWTGEGDTLEFFERYGRVAQHYALLAELVQAETFCFGANLREVSRTDPKATVRDPELFEQRRAGWRELIQRLHAAYHGTLTYSFRFPVEGSESAFLEQLDAVGVGLYPRVAQPGRVPSDEELRRNLRHELQQALDLAVRWNKPLVLVQLGFPARADSWFSPTVPRGARDPLAQQRFYEALADVLAGKLENGAMLRGYYLWNWPVGSPGSDAPTGDFGLRGQPAESALRRLFER